MGLMANDDIALFKWRYSTRTEFMLNISTRLCFSFNNSVNLVFELYFDYSFWYFESPLHGRASFSIFCIGHKCSQNLEFSWKLYGPTWSFNNLIFFRTELSITFAWGLMTFSNIFLSLCLPFHYFMWAKYNQIWANTWN